MVTEVAVRPANRRIGLPGTVAFWSLAAMLCLLQFASAAPSPMYGIYQHAWHFSPVTLTAVYAANALALLVTLLFVGSLSDHVGRRPVLLVAALTEVAAMTAFAMADGVAWLVAGRVLQGVATGTASGAISAMLIDLQKPGSRLGALMTNVAASGGIALGALGSGLLVQYGPAPTRLVYVLLLTSFAGLLLLAFAMPETVTADGAWRRSLRPRAAVPPSVRGAYAALLPSIVAAWALAGLYLSLGPSVVATLSHSTDHLVGGLVIVALNGTAVVLSVLGRGWSPERALYLGSGLLMAGVALAMLALNAHVTALFFAGTMVAGAGFGPSFSGALRILTGLAPAERRAEVVTAIYLAAYLGLSVPAVVAGVAVTHAGLFATAYGYGVGVIALTGLAVLTSLRGRRRAATARATAPLSPHHQLPPCPGGTPALARHR
ncbi:MFS transporter [Actinoallomurus sp. NPDC050550]|uniref:MFS transporter n=1 Tax=Actinoallomurus sp. NPDC050550 TaxID=3154937 RepID=UPI003400FD99